ncbi:MAG TPA: DDE-type integrase/transposase/recombinase [Nitrososphaerales archaeon]|nr:DDE-type integrase/transposase/recombinase [Nitrososphaerales archaeon]
MTKALVICEQNRISENQDGSFSVPSQSKEGLTYEVRLLGQSWVCSCPDFETRADQIEACKHGLAVSLWIAARVEIKQAPKPKVFADDATQCDKCGSIRVIKFGSRRGKQGFKCNDCGRRFEEKALIRGSRYTPEVVSLTLDLYFSGTSLRKTARILNDHFDMNLGNATVFRWIQKFVPMISEYAQSLTPQLSETWQADEVFVKMRGGETAKGGMERKTQKGMAYLWNVMDRKTRFLLASRLSQHRNVNGAVGAFNAARKVAKDSQPEKIFVDGLNAYPQAMTYWESESKPELVARMGVGKPHANNNRIERLNGTSRERIKVQRGWKSMKTQLAEGQRIQYNFVKPHMALENQTPAESAGIGVEGKDKWLELISEAIKEQ